VMKTEYLPKNFYPIFQQFLRNIKTVKIIFQFLAHFEVANIFLRKFFILRYTYKPK
jgi:hypothetical protein